MKPAQQRTMWCTLVALAGCIDPVEPPQCIATELTQTSLNGDTVTLNSGLRYIEGAIGSGTPAQWCRSILTHHREALADGTVVSDTHDFNRPILFTPGLGEVIDGYEQGVIGMQNAGGRRLIVPPHLGYGSVPQRNAAGQIVIPANSTLIYDIETFNIPQ
jgi:peptidylprolyl isomerase